MAEISNASERSGGKVRTAKRSLKIDMTPMVDLAFLLLTFFILTTTFNNPRILELPMPDKGDPSRITADNVLNIVLDANNKVFWWIGIDGEVSLTNYSNNGLRKVLLERTRVNPQTMVLIKPKDNSKYENVVDVLDELTITGTTRYAIVDFTGEDRMKLKN